MIKFNQEPKNKMRFTENGFKFEVIHVSNRRYCSPNDRLIHVKPVGVKNAHATQRLCSF